MEHYGHSCCCADAAATVLEATTADATTAAGTAVVWAAYGPCCCCAAAAAASAAGADAVTTAIAAGNAKYIHFYFPYILFGMPTRHSFFTPLFHVDRSCGCRKTGNKKHRTKSAAELVLKISFQTEYPRPFCRAFP